MACNHVPTQLMSQTRPRIGGMVCSLRLGRIQVASSLVNPMRTPKGRCRYPAQEMPVFLPRGTSVETPPATEMAPKLVEKVLWVRHLPWNQARTEAESLLKGICPTAVHVVVVPYGESDAESHRGYAFVAFQDKEGAASAMTTIQQNHPQGPALEICPAPEHLLLKRCGKLIKDKPELLKTEGELRQEYEERDTRAKKKAHRKRKKKRSQMSHISMIDDLLSSVPPPAGHAATDMYQPIASSGDMLSHIQDVIDWDTLPSACRTTVGLKFQDVQSSPPSEAASSDKSVDSKDSDSAKSGLRTFGGSLFDQPLPRSAKDLLMPSRQTLQLGQDDPANPLHVPDSAPDLAHALKAGRVVLKDHVRPSDVWRTLRKRAQVESFALILKQLIEGQRSNWHDQNELRGGSGQGGSSLIQEPVGTVIEFGSGSGNLILPLAAAFPEWRFHAIDYNTSAIRLLQERIESSGLQNVTATVEKIEEFHGHFDVALALHACGNATDFALLQAQRCRAAFICSPCCIGKLKFSPSLVEDTSADDVGGLNSDSTSTSKSSIGLDINSLLQHPRSSWMRSHLLPEPEAAFRLLAQSADISHSQAHSHASLAVLSKLNLEIDRAMAAGEEGYSTAIVKLLQPELLPFKADIIIGAPNERICSQTVLDEGLQRNSIDMRSHSQQQNSPIGTVDAKERTVFYWPWQTESPAC